jgi:hypothetical protein
MEGDSVGRLMEIILQMKINLVHVTETLQQQTHEMREQLGIIFEDEKRALEDCLHGIDNRLTECSMYIENYKRLYADLVSMRDKLVQLGAEPSSLPSALPTDQVEGVMAWRLQELRAQGRV